MDSNRYGFFASRQFNRAIQGQGEPMTSAHEGLRALAVAEAMYESVRGGRVVKVAEFLG